VPDESFFAKWAALPGEYHGRETAMALAWWFLAANPYHFRTRVITHKFEHSYKVTDTDKSVEIDPESVPETEGKS